VMILSGVFASKAAPGNSSRNRPWDKRAHSSACENFRSLQLFHNLSPLIRIPLPASYVGVRRQGARIQAEQVFDPPSPCVRGRWTGH
jgi:hypothetical protein